jgi:hypothetical protein
MSIIIYLFARPVYNEQLYSLIVWSKVSLFSPWVKNRSQLKLLVIFFSLGQKTIAYSTFYGTYLFRINFFFTRGAVCVNLEQLYLRDMLAFVVYLK